MHQHPRRTSVGRLTLTDFRNFGAAAVECSPHCVVLLGANGSGKTNCLEAVSLLSPGKGLRGAAAAEMARRSGAGGWSISAKLIAGDRLLTLGTGLPAGAAQEARKSSRRQVKIDGEMAASSSALGEAAAVVWLTPAMDGLFTGPASDRRRFLDQLAGGCTPAHRGLLARYDLAMRQRNRLLLLGETNPRYYESYERQMAEAGVAIAAARVETVDRLTALIQRRRMLGQLPFPWAAVALEGELEQAILYTPAVEVEDGFAQQLALTREQDRTARRTSTGPHCSDLSVAFGPKEMPARLCSTGEQKALLIGLILAQADLIKQARGGAAPIILLDEIAAHLDGGRREALFKEILNLDGQAWMTGTDETAFAALGPAAQFFNVSDGVIEPAWPFQTHAKGRAAS
jgi:DNA replication and repair protein RecF